MTEEKKDVMNEEQEAQGVLQIPRIYVKDISFEAPNLPHIFHQEWKPKLSFDLSPLKPHWKIPVMWRLFVKLNKPVYSRLVV